MRVRVFLKRSGAVVLVFVVLAAFAAGGAWLWMRQSLPQLAGEAGVAGISAPVTITRDANAVPHIVAATWNDAYFALGYAHAQDRLWQMEMNRRIGAGRLAEVLGESALDTDKFFRTLGLRRVAEATVPHLDVATRAALDNYAAGVNAFIRTHKGPLPPEFLILGVEPEPWQPADSVAWGKVMAWDLSGNWRSELLRLRLSARLSPKQIAEFLPPYPGDPALPLPDLKAAYAGLESDAGKLAALFPPQVENAVGSNNWVVSSARSANGKPLLANDPHLGLATPAIWYFAHLSVNGENIVGATLPGAPSVVLGHNDRIAWGFTNTGPDVQDLFIEKPDPSNAARYVTPDGPREFTVRNETIRVKGKPDVTFQVRESRHGPIISDVVASAAKAIPNAHALAFGWTALQVDDLTAQANNAMPHARDWTEFRAALRDFAAPQQNMVYADVDGNTGFIAPGRIPVRKPENTLRGLAPAPGWDARYDWDGFVPFDALPQSFNPASGMVVTANQKVVGPGYPHFITSEWAPPYRSDRIEALLNATPLHTVESFRAIQADTVSLPARDFLPLLLAVPPQAGAAAEAHRRLAAWNGDTRMDATEPLIFAAWMRELTRLVYADELGPDLFRETWDQRSIFMRNVLRNVDGQGAWCDDINTPEPETCAMLIARALPLALEDLTTRYGPDWAKWRWADAHPAISDHRPFARQAQLNQIFSIAIATPGDSNTVDVGSFRIANEGMPFASRHAASMRAIYDLADLNRSRFMHSTGQSGNVFSRYYANFTAPWAAVESVTISAKPAEFEAGAIGTLRLVPAP